MILQDRRCYRTLMSLLIRYSPMASYFCLSIIFLPLQILHHGPHQHDLPHDHHWLCPIPIALLAQHHVVDLAYDLRTMLFYFPFLVPFQLPDAPCCGLTSHKPSHHMVRTLPSGSLHTNLVLIFTYHLYLKLLYLPQKRRKFFPQNSDLVHSAWLFCLTPLHTFALLCTSNSPHTLVPSQTFAFPCLTLPAIMLGDRPVEIRTSFTFSLYEHLFTFIYFLLYLTIDSALAPYYLDYSFIMVSSSYSKLRCIDRKSTRLNSSHRR